MLEAEDVWKSYGDLEALRGVSLKVKEGEVFGLLGPNGAGKTTFMEIVVGLKRPDRGRVLIRGEKVGKETSKLVGYSPQEPLLYSNLTGFENLEFYASLYGLSKREVRERVKELADLVSEEVLKKVVSKMSGGQKRKVNLLVALVHRPSLLVLDEPTVGLDPDARREFWGLIRSLKEEGTTILLSTHYMEEAEELCERVAVMDSGKVVALGTPKELKERYGGAKKLIVEVRELEKASSLLENAKLVGEGLLIESDRAEELVPEVVSKLQSNGVEVRRVEIRGPTLEDVFLNLTGRRLE